MSFLQKISQENVYSGLETVPYTLTFWGGGRGETLVKAKAYAKAYTTSNESSLYLLQV